MDSRLESTCQQFISHNLQSGNLGTLVDVFLRRANELLSLSDQQNNVHVWQTCNALFIVRTLVKYMIETCSEFQLLQHFEAKSQTVPPANGTSAPVAAEEQKNSVIVSKFEAFVEAIINLVVVIPVK